MTRLLDDGDLDLSMREADVAIRMHAPRQPDLVQRHLMNIAWAVVASRDYLAAQGVPQRPEELDNHKLVSFGDYRPPVPEINWLLEAGRRSGTPRRAALELNSLHGMSLAIRAGMGIGALPHWMLGTDDGLVRLLPDLKAPKVEVFFVYPEELRNSKRVAVFRDFLVHQVQEMG